MPGWVVTMTMLHFLLRGVDLRRGAVKALVVDPADEHGGSRKPLQGQGHEQQARQQKSPDWSTHGRIKA